jgi:hypothetical protein
MIMNLKKVEENLTEFSKYVLNKVELDCKLLQNKNAKTSFDKEFKKRVF